ncbi:MAG: LysM peptidoglycan-binding domain-containing protein [Planctomycetota bacterium]|jgi:nucleoid-associated protein YgaU
MQKDLKIGLALGLMFVSTAVLWLATRPSLSPMARLQHLNNTRSQQEPAYEPVVPVIANSPGPNSVAGQVINLNTSSDKIPSEDIGTGGENALYNPPDSTIYEQDEKIKPEKFHIVLKGQTLSKISYKYYGSARQWPKILEANRKTIKDPDKLIPGTKLIIPD